MFEKGSCSPSRSGAAVSPAPASRKILLLSLCTDCLYATDGSTNWFAFDVGSPEAQEVGPYIEDIVISAHGKAFSAFFNYRVVAEYSNDHGQTWKGFANPVLGLQTAVGHVNGAAYTTRTDFGLRVRFKIEVANSEGTVKESGVLTVTAVIKVWT